jgi:hypothetical protein
MPNLVIAFVFGAYKLLVVDQDSELRGRVV